MGCASLAWGVLLLGQVLLLLFVVGPLSSVHPFFYDVVNGTQLLLLAISYFVLPRGSNTRLLILVCFVPMLWVLVAGSNQYIGLALRMFVTLSITVAVAQMVFRAKSVSRHQLFGAVVVYLNLAPAVYGQLRYPGQGSASGLYHLHPGRAARRRATVLQPDHAHVNRLRRHCARASAGPQPG